jgi:hypothetical protein
MAFMTAPLRGRDGLGPVCTAQRDVRLGKKQNRAVGLSQREHESEEIFNQQQCLAKNVTGPSNRADLRGFSRSAELLAQAPHMNIDQIRARVEAATPHALEDHRTGEHLARVAHHVFEQFEFGWLEVQHLTVMTGSMLEQIEFQFANLKARFSRALRGFAPQEHLGASGHFFARERLGEIVVATGP